MKKKFCLGLLAAALSVGSASAQCVVGATDFETETALFNPNLPEDETGWFSEDVGDLLDAECGKSCKYFEEAYKAIQTGMPSNNITSNATTAPSWEDLAASGNTFGAGFGGITANPKILSPYLSSGNGGNMYVAIANAHESPFLSYTVSGLAPNSKVTLSVDILSLFDPVALEAQLMAMNEGVMTQKDLVTQLNLGGGLSFVMQSSGTKLTPGSGMLNGNKANIVVCTALQFGQASGDSEGTLDMAWGSTNSLTLSTTASDNGVVTFYFMRKGGANFAPVGIDNIKVEGTIAPAITSQKKLPVCPANPVMLNLKQSYPNGTKFSWKGGDETSSTSSFAFTPAEAEKTYPVSVEVTMPGCKAVSASINVTTKSCCTMKDDDGNDVPMAETNVFYDDFGSFPDNSTYEYTDPKGLTHTKKVEGGLWTDVTRPFVTVREGDAFTSDLGAYKGTGGINELYCITNVNPYTPGVEGDASGTKRGGMMIFDLGGSATKGLVLYEREICGLCKGKEITFGTSFGAINNNPAGVGEMAIYLRKGSATGEILYEETSGVLKGGEGWRRAEATFTIDEDGIDCVVLQVVNIGTGYGDSQGDFAIDDIQFTVCTPPDIAVDAELSGNAKDLLDLCTDDLLTLKAEISETAKSFYGNTIKYLFQYTFQDPQKVDDADVKWFDLSEVQDNGAFEIKDPATHPAFSKIQEGEEANIYFRVVIGKGDYLVNNRKEWESMSALSPCRAISISSIPIVAGLNCAACVKAEQPEIIGAEETKVTLGKEMKEVNLC
ncbi:MAG: hypothetical protein UF067_04685, partial [Paludibacteraceae bacterium]|nr:hypothetical protein [Paludibacteraceae bacterium]